MTPLADNEQTTLSETAVARKALPAGPRTASSLGLPVLLRIPHVTLPESGADQVESDRNFAARTMQEFVEENDDNPPPAPVKALRAPAKSAPLPPTAVKRRARDRFADWVPRIPTTMLLGIALCIVASILAMLMRGDRSAPQVDSPPAENNSFTYGDASASADAVTPSVDSVRHSHSEAVGTQRHQQSAQRIADERGKPAIAVPAYVPSSDLGCFLVPAQEAPTAPVDRLPPAAMPRYPSPQADAANPSPQVIHNPYQNGPAAVYEARRPAVEFRGTITKPDAASTNERY